MSDPSPLRFFAPIIVLAVIGFAIIIVAGRRAARRDKARLEELGNDTRVSTPAEFRARVELDMARWRPLAHVVNQS